MPEEDKKMVPIDTSGPDAEVDIEEKKDEAVIEQPEQETENTEQGTDKTFENERETKLDEKKDDDKLEEYSKGVQARPSPTGRYEATRPQAVNLHDGEIGGRAAQIKAI